MSNLTYNQKYYQDNKEKQKAYLKEKVVCECGSVTSRYNMFKHKKTKMHNKRLYNIQHPKIKQITCTCGMKIAQDSILEHETTKKHRKRIRKLQRIAKKADKLHDMDI